MSPFPLLTHLIQRKCIKQNQLLYGSTSNGDTLADVDVYTLWGQMHQCEVQDLDLRVCPTLLVVLLVAYPTKARDMKEVICRLTWAKRLMCSVKMFSVFRKQRTVGLPFPNQSVLWKMTSLHGLKWVSFFCRNSSILFIFLPENISWWFLSLTREWGTYHYNFINSQMYTLYLSSAFVQLWFLHHVYTFFVKHNIVICFPVLILILDYIMFYFSI